MLKKTSNNVVMDVALMDELEMLYGEGLQSRIKKTHNPPSIGVPPTNLDPQLSVTKELYSKFYDLKDSSIHEKTHRKKDPDVKKKSNPKPDKILAQH
jgi:hypothetical protein